MVPATSPAGGLVEGPNSLAGSSCHHSVQTGHEDSRYLTPNLFTQHRLKGLERLKFFKVSCVLNHPLLPHLPQDPLTLRLIQSGVHHIHTSTWHN